MAKRNQSTADEKALYFDVQADFGITKHMGGLKSTRELLSLCHIQEGQLVLDVGCGIGSTACYIAKNHGCRVVGIDISERMVARSKDRAKREGLETRVEFRVADAQHLPFDDGLFDAVISESVTAFVEDKQRAVREYMRVVKPGGYVGLNEVTWRKTPAPELVKYISFIMARVDFLPPESWRQLLESSGLRDMEVRNYPFDARRQFLEENRQLDLREYFRAWFRFLTQSIANPAYRRFTKEVLSSPKNIFRFLRCIGYGIYVGRK